MNINQLINQLRTTQYILDDLEAIENKYIINYQDYGEDEYKFKVIQEVIQQASNTIKNLVNLDYLEQDVNTDNLTDKSNK
tara:strand:+ start:36 stop:275 length:240 start_codon:yes stop_codon:yes gene_type:complete